MNEMDRLLMCCERVGITTETIHYPDGLIGIKMIEDLYNGWMHNSLIEVFDSNGKFVGLY